MTAPAPRAAHPQQHHAVWPRRLPHGIHPPAASLWTNLQVSALRYGDKTALQFLGQSMSYATLMHRAERLAAQLLRLGVRRGERVVLNMQNCPQLVVAHFAILRLGAVVVPVNPMNRAEELKHYITDPDAQVALTTADLLAGLLQANAALPAGQRLAHVVCTQWHEAFEADGADLVKRHAPEAWHDWLLREVDVAACVAACVAECLVAHGGQEEPDRQHAAPQLHTWAQALACPDALPALAWASTDLAVLPYTSGTTGLPKGCMHTHTSIMHNAVGSSLWGGGSAENVVLCVVPMFHITGMVSVMHACVYTGATLVLMPRWDRDLAGRLISQHRVTHWTNIPTMVMDLLASPHFASYDLSSLLNIGGGGAAMPQAVAQRLFEQYGLRYVEGYGLTETAAPSHTNPFESPKQQCLGIPFFGTDARIIDPDTLQELPQGESGEIIIHGPEVFTGYWKRPEATAQAFIELDGQRFFRSGDLGRVDEEGYFFMTDRLKRMINASGFKVWPAEVEALMFKHPAVAEACVIGVQDSYRGETVKAVVVLRASHKGAVSEADLLAWCRENMAVYKAPRLLSLVDALPKSGSGKVMWRLLQEQEAKARL
jgi:fatty-acyl-CoA synthase